MVSVAHCQPQVAFAQFVGCAGDELLAVGEDDFRHAGAAIVIRYDGAAGRVDPAAGVGRGMLAPAPVERVAGAVGLDAVVVGAHGSAHALFVDNVETALELEPAKVVNEIANATDTAFVTGVLRDLVMVVVDRIVAVVVEIRGQRPAVKGSCAEQFGVGMTVAAELLVDHQFVLERTAGDDVDRTGKGFRCNQTGSRASRNVDAFESAQADAIQAVGRRDRREDRDAIDQQRCVATRQIVQHDVADVADRTLGLHREARAFVDGLGQRGCTALFDIPGTEGFGGNDLVPEHGLATDGATTANRDFTQFAVGSVGIGPRQCKG